MADLTPTYDQWADTYDLGYRSLGQAVDVQANRLAQVLPEAVIANPGRYLDVGCATGVSTAGARSLGFAVTGMDASPAMIAKAALNFPDLAFSVGGILQTPASEPFDVVRFPVNFVTYFGLAELFSAVDAYLNPGGHLLLEFSNFDDLLTFGEAQLITRNIKRETGTYYIELERRYRPDDGTYQARFMTIEGDALLQVYQWPFTPHSLDDVKTTLDGQFDLVSVTTSHPQPEIIHTIVATRKVQP